MRLTKELVTRFLLCAGILIVILCGLQSAQAQCVSPELKEQWRAGNYEQVLRPLIDCYGKRSLGVAELELEYMIAKTLCNVPRQKGNGCRAYSSLKANHTSVINVFGHQVNLDRDACCRLPDYTAASSPEPGIGVSQQFIRVPFSEFIRDVQGQLATASPGIRDAESVRLSRYSEITSKLSGRCMDIMYGSTENGALLLQFDCHNQPNQLWTFVRRDDGYYNIVVSHSNKCLDVNGSSQDNGIEIFQHDCHDGDNQRWAFVRSEDGYSIVAKHSGKCLDVFQANPENMAHIVQWDCHGGPNQKWTFSNAGPGVTVGPPPVRGDVPMRILVPPPPQLRKPPGIE